MRYLYLIPCCALLTACQSGPDLTNPPQVRQRAADLAPTIAELRTEREADLNLVNARYRQSFAVLMDDFSRLERLDRAQQGYAAAQASADAIQSGWETKTLKSELHTLFTRDLNAELERVDAMYKALADVRQAYANGYQEAALKLDKLKEIEAAMRTLSVPAPLSPDTLAFFKAVVEAAKKAYDDQKAKPVNK